MFVFGLFFSGPLSQKKIINIPYGSSVNSIAKLLEDNNVIYNKYIFLGYVKVLFLSNAFIFGEFEINQNINLYSLIRYIASDKNILSYKFILIEGYTTKQALSLLNEDTRLVGEISLSVAEGELMPDTYFFNKKDTKDSIILRMKKSMETYLLSKWESRDQNLPYKNMQQALILASLVEKEATIPSERPIIASVFLNRLRIGMPLQTDPSIAYALGKENADKLTRADLKFESPYNTYLHYGLTPTPIANPSRGCIDAVFQPASTKYLYFVADGKGGHIFAQNLVEHNKNVAKWREIEKNIRLNQKKFS
jgi:UPF0755 protein